MAILPEREVQVCLESCLESDSGLPHTYGYGLATGIDGRHVMVAGEVISSTGLVHDEVVRLMSAVDDEP